MKVDDMGGTSPQKRVMGRSIRKSAKRESENATFQITHNSCNYDRSENFFTHVSNNSEMGKT